GGAFLSVIQTMLSKEGNIGENGTTQHIRKIFKSIVSELDIKGEKAIDLSCGFGSVAFDTYNLNSVKSLLGIERNPRICEIAKIISIISGFERLEIICQDTLLFSEDDQKEGSSYSLVLVDPPLGRVPEHRIEYGRFE